MKALRQYLIIIGVIAIVVLAHFSSALGNEFSLDDYLYIDQVKNILSWSDLHLAFQYPFSISDFRPITSVTFAIENILFRGQINPHVSHGVNLFIYYWCCILFYIFLKKIITDEQKKPIIWIATLLFITLPLHNSMVSNIKSRDGLLSFMFGMLYLNTLVRIHFTDKLLLKVFYLVISFVFIGLGIFSKLDGFNFLLISPFLFLYFDKKVGYKNILRFLLAIILALFLAHHVFDYWSSKKESALEIYSKQNQSDPILFSENPIIAYSEISYKIAYAVQTVYEYSIMVFAINGHYFYYGYDMLPVLPLTEPSIILKALIIFAIILSAFIFYQRNRLYSFGVVFYFICLIYCCNFLTPISGIIADRYIFTASAGACIVLAIALHAITKYVYHQLYLKNASNSNINNDTNKNILQLVIYIVPILLLTSLFYLPKNIERCKDWKSLTSIFEADLPKISMYSYDANLMAMKNYMSSAEILEQPQKDIYCDKVINYGQNARRIYPNGQYAKDLMITAYYEKGELYNALDLSREVIARFDTTEIGWRVLNEYYYIQLEFDSMLISSRKVLKFSPLDPYINMMYFDVLKKIISEQEALKYIDTLKSLYPESPLPQQILEMNKDSQSFNNNNFNFTVRH